MQTIEREQHVTRHHESRRWVSLRGERRERIVSRHMRVDDLNPMVSNYSREIESALQIERIAQTDREDVLGRKLTEHFSKWGIRTKRSKDIMSAPGK